MGYSFAHHGTYKGKDCFQLTASDDFESKFGEQFVFAYSSESCSVSQIDRYCQQMNRLYAFTRDANE